MQRTPAPFGTPVPTVPSPAKNTFRIPAAGAVRWFVVTSRSVSLAREAVPLAFSTAPVVAVAPKLAQPPAGFAGWPHGQLMTPPVPGKQFCVIGDDVQTRTSRLQANAFWRNESIGIGLAEGLE